MNDVAGAGAQVQYSLNPLLPPGCVPLVELIGLEAVVDQVLMQMAQRDGGGNGVDESDDEEEEEEEEEIEREYPDNQQECTKCGRDYSPGWWRQGDEVLCFKCAQSRIKRPIYEHNKLTSVKVVDK